MIARTAERGAARRRGQGIGRAALSSPGFIVNVGTSVLVTVVVIAVFAGVAGCLDSTDLRAALARLRARPS